MNTQVQQQKARIGLLVPLLGFGLFLLLYVSLVLAVISTVGEMPLNQGGSVTEINMVSDRKFWVTDYGADEIWYVDVDNNSYVTYQGLKGPDDARSDGRGNAWWINSDDNTLGQLMLDTATITTWPLPVDGSPSGTAIGSNDQIWVSDSLDSHIYRFDISSSELCTYTVPTYEGGDFLLFSQERLWLGDSLNEQLLKVNPNAGEYTTWSLASGAQPQGLAMDDQNNLWWIDPSLNFLGRLNATNNSITTYDIPTTAIALNSPNDPNQEAISAGIYGVSSPESNTEPFHVTHRDGAIWFTDWSGGRVGFLDPSTASGSTTTITPTHGTVPSRQCQTVEPLSTSMATTSSGTIQWTDNIYDVVKDSDGWLIYQLPGSGSPWGIAADAGNVWFTDQGRQVVGRFELISCFELTLEKTGSGARPVSDPVSSSGCPTSSYTEGQVIYLLANPSAGWTVDQWTGTDDDVASTTNNFVTMPGNEHSVAVHYVEGNFQYLPMVTNR